MYSNILQYINKIAVYISLFTIAIVLNSIFPAFANATDYYVRPNEGEYGSENGSNYANAFDGFADIDWSAVDSGNGKLFICGDFSAEQLTIPVSGEKGFPIHVVNCTIENGASTNDPGIIDGKGTSGLCNGEGLVDAVNLSHIIIDGLEILNSPQTLVRMKSCTYSKILNCKVHDNENSEYSYAHGININFSDYCEILNNEVYASNRNAIVVEGAENNIIEGNYIHDNPAHNCLDFKEGNGGTTLQSGNIVRYNTLTGCTNGILSAYQSNQLIHNNLIYKNAKSAMWFINTGSPAQTYVANSKIYNNTCVDNALDGIQNEYARNLTVINNIFSNGRNEISLSSTANQGHTINNNLYGAGSVWKASGSTYDYISAWYSGKDYDSDSIEDNPGFVDRSKSVYSLVSGSSAIDIGRNLISEGISLDIDGSPRPQGKGFDVGAYEFSYGQISGLQPPKNLRVIIN